MPGSVDLHQGCRAAVDAKVAPFPPPMSTTTTPSNFASHTTVGEIVAAQPILARVFERVGIDYCCGGKKTLAQACAAKGLDPATVAVLLDAAAHLSDARPAVDGARLSLSALADHIEQTHHRYIKNEMLALMEKAERVGLKHGWRDSRLPLVGESVRALAEEMLHHIEEEEQVLFPLIRQLEQIGRPDRGGSIKAFIEQMEAEHQNAGATLERVRGLTDQFTPDADACNTHRALLAGLAHFERDLHEHVSKENNILFPRALALEAELASEPR